MRKETVLIVLGFGVYAAPFLGVPELWRTIVLFVLGGLIILTSVLLKIDMRRRERTEIEVLHREHDPREEPLVTPRA